MEPEKPRAIGQNGGGTLKTPLVSILMPTYNHERYVRAAISSVLAQTYPHWELIAVDDGSTDRTTEILRACGDPRVRVVERPHKGIHALAENYNLALELSQGELIAVLEGDDLWPPDKLEVQVPSFEDPDVILTWGIGVIINAEGVEIGSSPLPRFRCLSGRSAFRGLLLRNYATPTVTVMARADVLRRVRFVQPRGSPFVDYPTWFHLTDRGKLCCVNAVLGFWRVHEAQATKKLGRMWRGDVATYTMLWREGRVSPFLFGGLVSLATAKLVRRAILAHVPGKSKWIWGSSGRMGGTKDRAGIAQKGR